MTASLDIPTVNALLAERMTELAHELAGEPTSRNGDELRFRSRGSLSVFVAGLKRGRWRDYEVSRWGDPLGLVAHLHQTSMRDAYAWALAWLGEVPSPVVRRTAPSPAAQQAGSSDAEARKRWSLEKAARIWDEASDPAGTLVEAYLASRGLSLPPDAPLRFHPRAWRNADNGPHGPAMVALMTDAETSRAAGVHVTYLQPDGSGKADGGRQKIMLGHVGVIRLVPNANVTTGLGLAEGIETALAVMQRAGWSPVWAATSAGAMRLFPVLAGIEALTIFADMDGPGLAAARECGQRWAEADREARLLAPPAGDWDSMLPRKAEAA